MKKLMIAAAIVCAAVVANASAFNWSNNGGPSSYKIYDKEGTVLSSGTVAYLLCTTDITQSKFLEGVRGATKVADYVSSKAIKGADNTVNGSAKISTLASNFDYGTKGNDYTFYYAIIKGDDILISDTKTGSAQESSATTVNFTSSATWSQEDNGTAAFSSAGWYAVGSPEPTPEPTSAMLMLLGVAGLALKRKRA